MQTPISSAQVEPLFNALLDPSQAVRLAALRALVRLPLDYAAWKVVSSILQPWLEQAADRADLDSLRVDRYPLWEILAAALYIPDSKVRDQIRKFRQTKNLPPNQLTRLNDLLVQAGDERTIQDVVGSLNPKRWRDWRSIAPVLYRLQSLGDLAPLQTAYDTSSDHELRFWLALALARWGEPARMRQLFEESGDASPLALEKAWPAFGPFSDRLHPFPAFPAEVQTDLYQRYISRPDTDSARLALLLLKAGMDPGEAATIPAQTTTIQAEPPASRWATPSNDLLDRLAQGHPLEPDYALLDSLSSLTDTQAAQLVTLGFAGTLSYILERKYAGLKKPGDAYGCYPAEAALQLGTRYQPELPGLFEIFLKAQTAHPARLGKLCDQIAWAGSRAGLEKVLAMIEPILYEPREMRRLGAARFIELTNLYADQPQPPGLHAISSGALLPIVSDVPTPAVPDLERAIAGGEMGVPDSGSLWDQMVDYSTEMAPTQKPVINTGWTPQSTPADRLEPVIPLQAGTAYYFWLNVDVPSKFSGETTPTEIQAEIAAGAILTVTLVGYRGSFLLDPKACTGELEVLPNGYAKVHRQPLGSLAPQTTISPITLYFPVQAPTKPGLYRLRCNIYYGQILLQSRLATARVSLQPKPYRPEKPAWQTGLDYHLASPQLATALSGLAAHKLSLQVNANTDGTHSFHLKGADDSRDFKQDDVRFTEGEMQTMITEARQALQIASWEKPDDWQEGQAFKYQDRQRNLERLRTDLVRLARWGYEFYFNVGERLAGGFEAFEQFEELMKSSGYVQIAMKGSPGFILPAALIYDYPLDTSTSKPYSLCQTFQDALLQNRDLEDEPCFNGDCPDRGNDTTVCPGGFWGFRHYLGLPLSLEEGVNAPLRIPYTDKPRFLMGEYSDFNLVAKHKDQLDDLAIEFSSEVDREKLLDRMKAHSSELIYFYCHGGLVRGLPFLVVGSKAQKGQIQPSNFLSKRIRWSDDPRPLIFLNGCHTSAVDPLAALSLLRGFIIQAQAGGLIGTEITIYEELAKDFAEAFFPRLLEGQTVGQALRGARLAILSQGNPLGLVYTPFVQAGLHLEKNAAAPSSPVMSNSTGLGMGMGLDAGVDPTSPFGL